MYVCMYVCMCVCMYVCMSVSNVRIHVWYGMVWYGMVWYGMVWYGMVWYGMVWYGMVWYGMVWYGMVWYGMVWHGMAWHGMAWHGMAWHGMVWYGMVWYGMVWYGMYMRSQLLPVILRTFPVGFAVSLNGTQACAKVASRSDLLDPPFSSSRHWHHFIQAGWLLNFPPLAPGNDGNRRGPAQTSEPHRGSAPMPLILRGTPAACFREQPKLAVSANMADPRPLLSGQAWMMRASLSVHAPQALGVWGLQGPQGSGPPGLGAPGLWDAWKQSVSRFRRSCNQ